MDQNTQVSEMKEFKRAYFRETQTLDEFKSILFSVWCYRGSVVDPKWKDVDTGKFCWYDCILQLDISLHASVANYTKLCSIEADLSHLPLTAQKKSSGPGNFYRLDYNLVLLFGLTEMKAQVVYMEKVSWNKSVH